MPSFVHTVVAMGGWVGEERRREGERPGLSRDQLNYLHSRMTRKEEDKYIDAWADIASEAILYRGLPATILALGATLALRTRYDMRPRGLWRIPMYGVIGVGSFLYSTLFGLVQPFQQKVVPIQKRMWAKYGRDYPLYMLNLMHARRAAAKTREKTRESPTTNH